MNKIVREHYPVANLPEDLREGLERDATVRVVIESHTVTDAEDIERDSVFKDFGMPVRKPLTIEETLEMIRRIRAEDRPSVSMEEAVARIRELRDEWDY
ncbi:hypothetical protein ABCW43_23770 [Neorhizobium sp. IRAMC:178]|uniref:hypothetical protein n=1 Tax=Neorhizobium tunisiense TaxID=3144793 RepID=UPI0031F5F5C8